MSIMQTAIIAAMIASFTIGIFLLPIAELNQPSTYNAGINTSELRSLNQITNLSKDITGIKDQVLEEGKVSTEQSEASFLTNAFTVGKFVFSGGPVSVIDGMLRDFVRVAHVPTLLYTLLIGILILVLSFAVVKSITGR